MSAVIETRGLTKHYGSVEALRDLDLEVGSGEIFGFLGPNGAGKTTTIRLLLDLIRPTRGSARLLGMDAQQAAVSIRQRTGYLPAELAMDPRLTAGQVLEHHAHLQGGVEEAWRDELVDRLGLDLSRRARALSSGNKKKVGIVQAFMHRPDLLILDEPTSGLDPLVQRAFLDLLEEVAADGACVFLSSHVLPEVEDVADRIGIIRDGELVTVDTVESLTRRAVRHLVLRFAEPVPEGRFRGLDGVEDVVVEDRVVDATITGSPDALVKAAAEFELVDLSPRDTELEDVFLDFYREDRRE